MVKKWYKRFLFFFGFLLGLFIAAWLAGEMANLRKYRWFRSRSLDGFDGWLGFFQEWVVVADELFDDWPYRKARIENPHEDWERAYQQMLSFLHRC